MRARLLLLPLKVLWTILMALAALVWVSRLFSHTGQQRDWRGRWR